MPGNPCVVAEVAIDGDRMTTSVGPSLPPAISAHRLLSDGRSSALLRPDGFVDWWCAPHFDSPPLLWNLLDPHGAGARWTGARMAEADGVPAGPVMRTVVVIGGRRVELRDGLVAVGDDVALVRLARAVDRRPLELAHHLEVGGFDQPPARWVGATANAGGRQVWVVGGESTGSGAGLGTRVALGPEWSGLAVVVSGAEAHAGLEPPAASVDDLAALLFESEAAATRRLASARTLGRRSRRVNDALAVLQACTFHPTGAVVASPTTSLPEAPGADRQYDYRYCWLRDAALAVSVASLLGDHDAARTYLSFVGGLAGGDGPLPPLVDIRGHDVPEERTVEGVAGWAGSQPVRVGNAAAGQVQYDALGMVVEAVSVHLQTGGSLDDATWSLVTRIADGAANDPQRPTNGIWELRDERWLVSADIGRWLALDRALWIARGWRPFARRRRWKQARDDARRRVLGVLGDDGRLPQTYDGGFRPDAVALLLPVFGMVRRRDPRAARIVDAVIHDLGAGPFVYRYEPEGTDGFSGREGAFVPASWWVVSALAAVGRVDEAHDRFERLSGTLPRLLPEEVDPGSGAGLGNVPLVWSHAEAARAVYVLEAAERRARWGAAGLWAWRLARFARLRWGRRS